MTDIIPRSLIEGIKASLYRIDYQPALVREEYEYVDFLDQAGGPPITVPLAAFAQDPPSYRTASMLVTAPERQAPSEIARFRAFGAPLVFAADPDGRRFRRWRMTAEGPPEERETIAAEELPARIEAERDAWGPEQVLRAKLIGVARGPEQLDLYDAGLLPVLDAEVQAKLDGLLKEALAEAREVYRLRHRGAMGATETRALYRLVFRLLAGKLLADRDYPGYTKHAEATDVIREVGQILFPHARPEDILADPVVRHAMWRRIGRGFDLRHISVEVLAYVYENTLVSDEARKRLDIHATPPAVAEYIVRQLPFADLPVDERRVVEPFAGHAPFLIAAMGQLKALLPAGIAGRERHRYLTRMLSGVEIEPFAAEVAQHSLMLADYPNGNGWDVLNADVFTSQDADARLRRARVVLSNPPYGRVVRPKAEGGLTSQAVEAVDRILEDPPTLLGLVLPLVFVDGSKYAVARRRLADYYDRVEVVRLPDKAFQHADVETVAVIASARRVRRAGALSAVPAQVGPDAGSPESPAAPDAPAPPTGVAVYVSSPDYARFLSEGVPTWSQPFPLRGVPAPVFWSTPLARVWDVLASGLTLGDAAKVSRGLEYKGGFERHRDRLTSPNPQDGFARGYADVEGGAYEPYLARPDTYLSVRPADLRRAKKFAWADPKVLVNFHRVSRGAWPVVAVVDRTGLAVTQNHFGVWPKRGGPELEVLAAVLNGPVANAFVAAREGKVHIRKRTLAAVPLPSLGSADAARVTALVGEYEAIRRQWLAARAAQGDLLSARPPGAAPSSGGAGGLAGFDVRAADVQREIDAIVLAGYGLPSRIERYLLDTFAGHQRPGPVPFSRFYPEGFAPTIPYRIYVSPEHRRATVANAVATPALYSPALSSVASWLEEEAVAEHDAPPSAAGVDAARDAPG